MVGLTKYTSQCSTESILLGYILLSISLSRCNHSQLEPPSPSQFPFLHRKILVSFSFLLQTSFALHQSVILSSNKWNFEEIIISQKGNNILLPNFQNSEALLIINYSCVAKLYMYIHLYRHLPILLYIQIWTHINIFQVFALINSSYFVHNSQFMKLTTKNHYDFLKY